jgi:hypothetical protein
MLKFPEVEYVDDWMTGESAMELCKFFKEEAEFDGEDADVWEVLEDELKESLDMNLSPLVSIPFIEDRLDKYYRARKNNH